MTSVTVATVVNNNITHSAVAFIVNILQVIVCMSIHNDLLFILAESSSLS